MIRRYQLWKKKTNAAKISAKPPALRSLPPTDPVLELNIKRAHYQSILWHSCLDGEMPSLDPCEVLKANSIKYLVGQ